MEPGEYEPGDGEAFQPGNCGCLPVSMRLMQPEQPVFCACSVWLGNIATVAMVAMTVQASNNRDRQADGLCTTTIAFARSTRMTNTPNTQAVAALYCSRRNTPAAGGNDSHPDSHPDPYPDGYPSSPCCGVCTIEDGLCIGCGRTMDEITAWPGLSQVNGRPDGGQPEDGPPEPAT